MSDYDPYGGTPNKSNGNCRTCTDFKFWSKQQRQLFHKSNDNKEATKTSNGNSNNGSADVEQEREDCPLDKNLLGKYTWGLLHTMAAFYTNNPTDSHKKDVKTFFDTLSRLYPCEYCSRDFQKDLREHPIKLDSQREFSKWLCDFHNRINRKLGKPIFDCSKVNERWRDGWEDGSCE